MLIGSVPIYLSKFPCKSVQTYQLRSSLLLRMSITSRIESASMLLNECALHFPLIFFTWAKYIHFWSTKKWIALPSHFHLVKKSAAPNFHLVKISEKPWCHLHTPIYHQIEKKGHLEDFKPVLKRSKCSIWQGYLVFALGNSLKTHSHKSIHWKSKLGQLYFLWRNSNLKK